MKIIALRPLAHRKSNDANRALKRASEAEATCHEAMDKIAELKKSLHSSEDHAKQISLNYDCAKIMDKVLANKGNAVFKIFDGEYSMEFKDYVKKKFARINLTKPKASRKQSSELYCVCLGFIG